MVFVSLITCSVRPAASLGGYPPGYISSLGGPPGLGAHGLGPMQVKGQSPLTAARNPMSHLAVSQAAGMYGRQLPPSAYEASMRGINPAHQKYTNTIFQFSNIFLEKMLLGAILWRRSSNASTDASRRSDGSWNSSSSSSF